MRKAIAKIRIATGNPGWYDSLTNIHLTIKKPEAFVYEGQNTINIKKGIAFKTVCLVDGSLDPMPIEVIKVSEHIPEPVANTENKENVTTEVTTEVTEKAVEATIEVVEEEVTEVVEEEVTETPKKKKPAQKSKKK